MCGNFKPTVNPCLHDDKYPIPNVEDLLSTLGGNSYFTSLDLKGAYLQLELDEESQELTTINTHLGLFKHTRLPYGIKTAPAQFKAAIDIMLNNLNVFVYFDDILIAGKSVEECYERTCLVLSRLGENNVRVNLEIREAFILYPWYT